MRVALRFWIAIMVATLVILVVAGLVQVSRETSVLEAELRARDRALGLAVAALLEGGDLDARVRDVDAATEAFELSFVAAEALKPAEASVLRAGELIQSGDLKSMRTLVPLSRNGLLVGAVSLREAPAASAFLATSKVQVGVTLLAALIALSLVVAVVGARKISRPVRHLQDALDAMGHGRAPKTRGLQDEFAHLEQAIASAHERLERARDHLRHQDRLALVGQLASGLAHEIGTPLNVALGRVQLLNDESLSNDKRENYLAIVERQIKRIDRIVRQLLDFSRREPLDKRHAALHEVARETVELLTPMAKSKGLTLETSGEAHAVVDKRALAQAISNLVVNGVQASDSGLVSVELSEDDDSARIVVVDSGPGIRPEDLPRVFDPFFTKKPSGEGTGLGLSIALGIVNEHDGEVTVSNVDVGARFTITLPKRGTP